jgi:glycosyltransferase involved in cell wall biosynthesis
MLNDVLDKRILLVGNFLSNRFNRAVCEDLADRLSASGWTVLTTSRRVGRAARLLDMIGTTWAKRHQYAMAQVDVYSGPAFFWAEAVCKVLSLAGKPFVLTLHGGNLPVFSKNWPRRVRKLLDSAAAVTTPSSYLLEQMQDYCTNLHLVNNPLDLNHYGFQRGKKNKSHLIWLRAFHEIYNPSLAPKVIALLIDEFPQIHLTMIGPDKGDGSLQQTQKIAGELKIEDRLTLTGGIPKSEVPAHLHQGDIFINTTNVDNTPVSILEAMACGLPIVSTDVGGIPYLLQHGHDALLVPANDPEAMAGAVRRVLVDGALAEQLSQNAREKAKQFDWPAIFSSWESLLLRFVQRQK